MTDVEPRPIKRLGQHFLRDQVTIDKMVDAAQIRPTDVVVEIGSGTGVLTRALAREADRVVAYEIDPDLVSRLKVELHYARNVEIVEQNVLAREFSLPKQTYKVVASLPYYITSPILEKLLLADPIASLIILMVQREVAEKIVAQPPDASYLSNFVRLFGEPEILAIVSPAVFFPRPEVDSAILRIKTLPTPILPKQDIQSMTALLHAGFTEPRKQLHNSLAAGLRIDVTQAKNLLQLSDIASDRRSETLSTDEWLKLYNVVKKA